jgi:hypothetical protein
MRIRDITPTDIRAGQNWRVVAADSLADSDMPLEDLKIEPLHEFALTDTVVYCGILAYLEDLGEPSPGRDRRDCVFPPDGSGSFGA